MIDYKKGGKMAGQLKKPSSSQIELEKCKKGIVDSIQLWQQLNAFGGNDPFWPDGCNMNLVRNHILYYKAQLLMLCESENCFPPSEYFFSVPPEVPNNYMANKDQTERIKKLTNYHQTLTFKKTSYTPEQLSFL